MEFMKQQRILWIFSLIADAYALSIGNSNDKIVDLFVYTPKGMENTDVQQWEFFVVGKLVPWNEAQATCPVYSYQTKGHSTSTRSNVTDLSTGSKAIRKPNATVDLFDADLGSHLATLDEETKDWLARMLAESNYRYDGLWIGGQRRNVSSNWTWVNSNKRGETLISDSVVKEYYPSWYERDEHSNDGKNCLVFDRMGHDVPTFVPENCQVRKPFVCMRPGKKKRLEMVVEGATVSTDGQLYTLYQVLDDEEEEDLRLAGVRKLNGGGITWREAKLECQKRGKYLAMVFSNEAAEAIAKTMLKSRPSMESAWLGGWSADGAEWTWISPGFALPAEKSFLTAYPPWLKGHPVTELGAADLYERRGRCLILDRHLCPEHRSPVFLDLSCEKKRPFICQDAITDQRVGYENNNRLVVVSQRKFVFSENPMTWQEGEEYCQKKSGVVASITDTKTLSAVLDKMAELSLDHTWVGGHTRKTDDGWRWLDEDGQVLSENGIALSSSWCLEKEGGSFHADGETCLNLDREGHGLPLFYGLPCNATDQYVLCNLTPRKGTDTDLKDGENEENPRGKKKGERGKQKEEEKKKKTRVEENEEYHELLKALITRIRKLADYRLSAMLFVLDDSLSVLNSWFSTQLQLAAAIMRTLFPLSDTHPMGLVTFSKDTKVILEVNQTDACTVLNFLSEQLLATRNVRVNNTIGEVANKTTDIINAARTCANIVENLNMEKVMMIFITDGEHVAEDGDKESMLLATEKLNNLRHSGHEIIGIVIRQGEDSSTNYEVVEELFPESSNGDKNLYFVQDYAELDNVTTSLSVSLDANYTASCGRVKWKAPEDDELLLHLLRKD